MDNDSIKKYIDDAKLAGLTMDQIKKALLDSGWPENLIAPYFSKIESSPFIANQEESKFDKIINSSPDDLLNKPAGADTPEESIDNSKTLDSKNLITANPNIDSSGSDIKTRQVNDPNTPITSSNHISSNQSTPPQIIENPPLVQIPNSSNRIPLPNNSSKPVDSPFAKKKSNSFVKIVLIIAFLLILAGIGYGGFYYYKNFIQSTTEDNSQNTNSEIEMSIYDELKNLLSSENFRLNTQSEITYKNCVLAFSAEIIKSSNGQYSKQNSQYLNQNSECDPSVDVFYYETYWIDEQIFSRNNPLDKISNWEATNSAKLAPSPDEYLLQLIPINNLKLEEIDPGNSNIKLSVENENLKGTYTVQKNQESGAFELMFNLQSSDNLLLNGQGTLIAESSRITLPEITKDPESLQEAFVDILKFTPVYYSFSSEKFLLDTTPKSNDLVVLSREGTGFVNRKCSLDNISCQNNYKILDQELTKLADTLSSAKKVSCPKESIFSSNVYKNKFVVKIYNQNRNPQNSFDYASSLSYDLATGKGAGAVSFGEETCYELSIDLDILESTNSKIEELVNSLPVID